MTDVLVFGATGQLGRALREADWPKGWRRRFLSRADCDLTDFVAVRKTVLAFRPHLIVNAAAYTAVDQAESEPELVWAANTLGATAIAEAAARIDAAVVHLSSDYVFSGSIGPAWREDDDLRPLNIYGATKAASEKAVSAAQPRHLIVRTAWVYDGIGRNFVTTMLRQGLMRKRLRVVNDQFGRPTLAADLAAALVAMTRQAMATETDWGVYHVTGGGGSVMWADFASAIFRYAEPWYGAPPVIEPISATQYAAAARRPANSVLDIARAEATFGLVMPLWQDSLRKLLHRPLAGLAAAPAAAA